MFPDRMCKRGGSEGGFCSANRVKSCRPLSADDDGKVTSRQVLTVETRYGKGFQESADKELKSRRDTSPDALPSL